jgi:small-conductance mechanosensitive channel
MAEKALIWRHVFLVVAAISLAFLGLPSASQAQEIDWSGTWDSRWRDGGATLFLEQDGDIVTGRYPTLEGSIRGEVRGQLLVGTWSQPSGSGRFIFSIAPDRHSFTGRFGTGEWWTGERIPQDRADVRVRADASTPRTALLSFVLAGNAARGNRIDRVGPALSVLDFSDLPTELTDAPTERLRLAGMLFGILDQLTFRVWQVPNPEPRQRTVTAELRQAGTGESFRLQFRYRIRPDGAAGWFLVVPERAAMQRALDRLLAYRDGTLPHDREHQELASPRDAMRTFIEQYHVWQDTGDSSLLFGTLNLSDVALAAREDEGLLRAQYLKEAIDRVGYVLWQEIPNNPDREFPYTHFVHPEGRIEIGPVETEDGGRIWQFTPDTLAAARPLYVALEDMPIDAEIDVTPATVFLQIRDTVRAIDRDLLSTLLGVEIWQWLALIAYLLVASAASWLVSWTVFRLILRMRREPGKVLSIRARFNRPLQVVIVALLGMWALRLIGLPESVDVPLRIVFGAMLSIAGGWLAYHSIDYLGSLSERAAQRFNYRDEMLRSLLLGLAKVAVIIGALLFLAEVLSIPYAGVIAGLGIGGIAVALAARSTIENFIGGLTLLADKPIKVGDFCRFGDQLGTVEAIGLRSVKVRSLGRTIVTIPNGEFVNLYLENYSRRDHILLHTTLQLRYETTPDQLRWVLSEVRRMLVRHPKVLAEPSRARFHSFGAYSLDIEIFAYVATQDWNDYLAIQEDLFLRIIDIVDDSGTGFAFPSSVNYLARDTGIDEERRERAEETVAQLRENDRLPFPDFDEDEKLFMFNRLEFPSPGSPHSRRAQERREADRPPDAAS